MNQSEITSYGLSSDTSLPPSEISQSNQIISNEIISKQVPPSKFSTNKNKCSNNGKVNAIFKSDLLHQRILEQALVTHRELSREDILYLIKLVMEQNLNNEDLAKFVAQTYKLSNTGRFSLSFNSDLDTQVKSRDREKVIKLILASKTKTTWPELYDNQLLNNEEITLVRDIANREYHSILYTLDTADNCKIIPNNLLPTLSSDPEILQDIKRGSNGKIYYNSLYAECYDKVCLYEAQQRGKIISLNSTRSELPKIAYVMDDRNNKPTKYCFDLMTLISNLAKGDYINPNTGDLFSERVINQLFTKYNIEIKMYKYYLNFFINKR
jgi:hypothetical protein